MLIRPSRNIDKTIKIPGDKSISHRAIMLSSIAEGESKIYNFLMGDDCLNTIKSFQQMGVDIEITDNVITVQGVGLKGLKKPKERLDVGNSGTTIRLLSG
ncbi:MAG: 3-phosphoshikimate 1-carboxyvinyltransferase, partial [Clostridiales bacterium]|nr:3-phosphoshikimate 1-carboxyvinyltransferase [Clostridiales bacterium]